MHALHQRRALLHVRRRGLWTGIGRVVYALSEHALLGLTGDHPENPTFSLPCREVFARGQRAIEVIGPLLEEEAAAPHAGFWDAPS